MPAGAAGRGPELRSRRVVRHGAAGNHRGGPHPDREAQRLALRPPGTRSPRCRPGRGGQACGHRPRLGRAGHRRMRDPGRRAGFQRDAYVVAAGRAALRRGRDDHRLPVRFVAAGQPHGQQPHRRRSGGYRDRLRRRDHESDPARGQRLGARRGPRSPRGPALRHAQPVRGGRAHRQEARHHPGGRRRLRARVSEEGRPGAGRGSFRPRDLRRRGAHRRRGGATRRARRREDGRHQGPRPA